MLIILILNVQNNRLQLYEFDSNVHKYYDSLNKRNKHVQDFIKKYYGNDKPDGKLNKLLNTDIRKSNNESVYKKRLVNIYKGSLRGLSQKKTKEYCELYGFGNKQNKKFRYSFYCLIVNNGSYFIKKQCLVLV